MGVAMLLNEIAQQLQVICCIDVNKERAVLFINIYNFTSDRPLTHLKCFR